jgi:glucosylglycerate synthase
VNGITVANYTLRSVPDASTQLEISQTSVPMASADVVIGVLTYNSQEYAGNVIRDAQHSLAACFPGRRGIVVHADGGSKDGTQEHAAAGATDKDALVQIAYTIYPAQKIYSGSFGVPGKANGIQAIFAAAEQRNASACAIVDSTIGMPAEGAIAGLLRPILDKEIDYVAPCYLRHKYDAAILNGIVYPFTRALYSRRVHQPIGGDYAVSGKLLRYLMNQAWPDGDATSSDADAWAIVHGLCGGFRIAEAGLGPRNIRPHDPSPDTSSILAQALGSLFIEMNRSAGFWQKTRGSQPVPVFGPHFDPPADPPPVDAGPMVQSFRLGYQNLQDIYRLILPPATLLELKRMSRQGAEDLQFDDTLWARIIYDFALAWRARAIDRAHLLGALTPLYLGWTASWVRSLRDAGPAAVEERIETLCSAYETQKGYLISRWRWPDRFNP